MSSTIALAESSARNAAPRRNRHPSSRGRRCLFAAMLLTLVAGVQEVLFRLVLPLPEVPTFNRLNYSPLLGPERSLAKDGAHGLSNVAVRYVSEPDGFAFNHALNLYGFRGPDFRIAPPSGRRRVLFVGDSFVEGFGAADEDTLPRQFERIVGKKCRVEALNLGVGGIGLADYAAILRDSLALLRPQAIVLVIYANDLPTPPRAEQRPEEPRDMPARTPFMPRAAQALIEWRAGRPVPRCFHRGPIPFWQPATSPCNFLHHGRPPSNLDPELCEAMRRGTLNSWLACVNDFFTESLQCDLSGPHGAGGHLRGIADMCRRSHVDLTLVYVPYHAAVNPVYVPIQARLGGANLELLARLCDPSHRPHQQHLRELARALGIPFLDTTDEFIQAESVVGRHYWPIDGHCNAAGYALLAQICARCYLSHRS